MKDGTIGAVSLGVFFLGPWRLAIPGTFSRPCLRTTPVASPLVTNPAFTFGYSLSEPALPAHVRER